MVRLSPDQITNMINHEGAREPNTLVVGKVTTVLSAFV